MGKMLAWASTVALLAALVQCTAWGLGFDFDILAHSARGLLLFFAVVTLIALLGIEQRPVAEYGLVLDGDWNKRLFGGFAIGLSTYAAYLLIVTWTGAVSWHPPADGYRVAKGGLSAMSSFPLAMTQQLIVSGYLLWVFRQRYGRAVSVLAVATIFVVLHELNDPLDLVRAENLNTVVGLFLVAAFLASLRLACGNILLPAGLLAGWLFARKLLTKADVLSLESPELKPWLLPHGDVREAPLMWVFLVAATAGVAFWIARHGEPRPEDAKTLDSDFKKVVPFSGFNNFAPLDVWLVQLWRCRLRVGLVYVPRLIASLLFSTLNTVLSLPERILLPLVLRKRKVPQPVFILGVHRSGTTHLHNLFSLDKRYVTPLAYHVLNPVGFLFSGWLLNPILAAIMPWKRPMDNVAFSLFHPQEEEIAMANSCTLSPYWALTLPHQGRFFDRYIFPDGLSARERSRWMRMYDLFLKKLTFWTRGSKTPLLKNPHNTGRVGVFHEMYPEAKFVHICRHPEDVYRSNAHLAVEGHCVTQLQDPLPDDNHMTRFLDNYRAMEDAYAAESKQLGPGQLAEVRYEDLVADPVGEVKRIYAELGLDFTPQFEADLKAYLESVAGYKRNRFRQLPEPQRQEIFAAMQPYYRRWGYAPREDAPAESVQRPAA